MTRRTFTRCMRSVGSALFVLCVLTGCTGCDRGFGQVTGKVSYQGQPLPSGDVVFIDGEGRHHPGAIAEDGVYVIDDVPAGPVKVIVMGPPQVPPGLRKPTPVPVPAAVESARPWVGIPERYKDPEKSGLAYTVKAGQQTINIDLQP